MQVHHLIQDKQQVKIQSMNKNEGDIILQQIYNINNTKHIVFYQDDQSEEKNVILVPWARAMSSVTDQCSV